MVKNAKWLVKEGVLRIKYMTARDCIFCKIVKGEIKSNFIGENEGAIAINDINPVSSTHVLIFPKKHIDSVLTINAQDSGDLVAMHKLVQKLVSEQKLEAFRLAYNGGKFQHMAHLHMHLLSGGKIEWKKL